MDTGSEEIRQDSVTPYSFDSFRENQETLTNSVELSTVNLDTKS